MRGATPFPDKNLSALNQPRNSPLPIRLRLPYIRCMASTPKKPSGFEEKPQPDLEGIPVEGGAMDAWLKQVEEEAAREQRDAENPQAPLRRREAPRQGRKRSKKRSQQG